MAIGKFIFGTAPHDLFIAYAYQSCGSCGHGTIVIWHSYMHINIVALSFPLFEKLDSFSLDLLLVGEDLEER